MKLIKPAYEIIPQGPREEGIYKQIEKIGRVCWKSESKITEDSYKRFVDMLKSKGHGAVLEHGTVYLYFPTIEGEYYQHSDGTVVMPKDVRKYYTDKYSYCNYEDEIQEIGFYITTNFRVLVQNNWLDDLKYLCDPTEYHEKRVTVKFICDRGVSHEFVRHRVFSFVQESTRYCNYSKDKFGNELTFIIPSWLNIPETEYGTLHNPKEAQFKKYIDPIEGEFINHLVNAEFKYLYLLKLDLTPEKARQVLPNALKTELVMTGFVSDWEHFFKLRCAEAAHPDARALAIPLQKEFKRNGWIN